MTEQVEADVLYKKGLRYLFGEGLAKNLVRARECFESSALGLVGAVFFSALKEHKPVKKP